MGCSYIKAMDTTLRAYNQSGTEQFLSMTKLHLKEIESTIKKSRCNEHEIRLKNNELSTQISQLKCETDSLYKELQHQENKLSNGSVANSKKTEKKDRRSQKDLGDSNERMIVETALHVIKGAIVKVMDIPTVRTT